MPRVLVPPARNLTLNPKPSSLTNMSVTASATMTLVEDGPEGMPYAVKVDALSAGSFAFLWRATATDDPEFIDADGTVHMGIYAKGATGGDWLLRNYIRYDDGTSNAANLTVTNLGDEWVWIPLTPESINDAKNVEQFRFYLNTPASGSIWLAGLDTRLNQVIDTLVHGDKGRYYGWEGTIAASASYRVQHFVEDEAASEYNTIQAGRNLAHNPRPTSLTYWSAGAGVTRSLVTDKSFSGTYSVGYQFAATGNVKANFAAAADDDPDIAALTSGDIYAAISAAGPTPAGLRGRLRLSYTDGTTSDAALVDLGELGEGFSRFVFGPEPIDITKTLRNIRLYIDVTAGAEDVYAYFGGLDIRHNQIPDQFIHGDVPEDEYAWEGTANDSPSTRSQYTLPPIMGHGGQFFPTIKVEVVNRQNIFLRDITNHFIDGDVAYDLDAEQWKGTCRLILDEPRLINPLDGDEYARITQRVAYPNGVVLEQPLGQFIMEPPQEEWGEFGDRWIYEGRDMLALLATTMIRGVVSDPQNNDPNSDPLVSGTSILQGVRYRDRIIQILTDTDPRYGAGLSASQINIPEAMNATAAQDMAWAAGTTALQIISEMCEGAGWQKPWVDPITMKITTAPAGTDPSLITPAVVFSTGENSKVRWPFSVDSDTSKVGNRIRVIATEDVTTNPPAMNKKKRKRCKKNPEEAGCSATTLRYARSVIVENRDSSHPLSFPRLGRWLDLPDVTGKKFSGNAALEAVAKGELTKAGSIPVTVRLVTEVHPRGLNEVYELDIRDAIEQPIPSGQGRYFCRGWSMQLGSPWEMVHNLKRIIPFSATPWVTE